MSKKEGIVTVSRKMYSNLLERDAFLRALEIAGVDNWEGYDEAVLNHRSR